MSRIILLVIIVLAALIRMAHLSSFPSGVNADEAALAYNAFSLLETGRDEHGHSWPVNLESFGDFKPAGYSYLLLPIVKLFGLSDFWIRLPSALFGVLAVIGICLLGNSLFGPRVGKIAALLLAVNPWHIHFSRGAWEVNVSTTLILYSVYFLEKWGRQRRLLNLVLAVCLAVASMYVYQSARIIAPVLLTSTFVFVGGMRSNLKQICIGVVVCLFALAPLAVSVVRSDAASRFSGVGFLSDEGPLNRVKEFRGHHGDLNSLFSRVFHNRVFIYSLQFAKNYSSHFSGDFIFIKGDPIERSRVPETGLMYLIDIIPLIVGIAATIKFLSSKKWIIISWLFIAPIASALTFQTPHALRAHNMIIPLVIFSAVGVEKMLNHKVKAIRSLITIMLVFGYIYGISRFLHQYFIHYPKTYPSAWQYGFRELVEYTKSKDQDYEKILVTDKYDQPYILFLYYLRYPPSKFQGNHVLTPRDKFNFSTVRDFDKYSFTSTEWSKVRDIHSSLIVASPQDIPSVGVNIIKTINFPNGEPAFKIISN